METRQSKRARCSDVEMGPGAPPFMGPSDPSVNRLGQVAGDQRLPCSASTCEGMASPPLCARTDKQSARGREVGLSNCKWQRALRLVGVTRKIQLKKIQVEFGQKAPLAPGDDDLYRSNIFPFSLFDTMEAEFLSNRTFADLKRDLRARPSSRGAIMDAPSHEPGRAHLRQRFTGRCQQPLTETSSLQREVQHRVATLLR
jgi:hypothetical protein